MTEPADRPRRFVLGITGASGAAYALRLMEQLLLARAEVHVVVTDNGRRARVYRLTREGRKRLKEIEESWATLTEGVKRVLRWA